MDIERYPTNETALRMLSRVSPIYDQSYVAKHLFQAMGIEMEEAHTRMDEELPLQAFPETATWGLFYWEQLYGIEIDETISVKERRDEVLDRRNLHGQAVNPKKIEEIASRVSGTDATVTENVADYTFQIAFQDGTFRFVDLLKKIDKMKPAHLNYRVAVNLQRAVIAKFGTTVIMKRTILLGRDTST